MTTRTELALTVRQDRRLIRPNWHSKRFLLARVIAPHAPAAGGRPPVNLAIVLDRSGSMSGEKLRVARSAVEEAIARLQPVDRFSVVAYDDVVEVVIGSRYASGEARRGAVERLRAIEARGSTNLGEGWLRGCEQVATHLVDHGINRCLLLTDGLANVGMTDPAELASHAAELRARGVSTSTFGVGNDFDERLLQELADAGGGHFYYIADAPQIRDAITSEVGETLEVVARDVTHEITARDDVRIEPISPYKATSRGNRTAVSLGDLGSDQAVEVVMRLSFPYAELGRETGVIVGLTDRDRVFGPGGIGEAEPARLTWTYADDRSNDAQPRDAEVDRAVARRFAARARQEAVRRNRAGDYAGATQVLDATARRIREYAGQDLSLRDLVEELGREQVRFSAAMAEPSRKAAHFSSANMLRSRDASGHSLKRG
ncbi:MAG: Ca-activated chloride channel [Chloroflexota bacterium]|nr:Ca-activated chloride channel [Chloroflexota bacterium]